MALSPVRLLAEPDEPVANSLKTNKQVKEQIGKPQMAFNWPIEL